jgi:hypothetical protein
VNDRRKRRAFDSQGCPRAVARPPAQVRFRLTLSPEIIEIFDELFRRATCDETILPGDETISGFSRRHPETPAGYQSHNETARQRRQAETGDSQMRTLSFILAFAFVLAGPSVAGWSDTGLPGIGTFAYNGSPSVTAPQTIVVAAR